MKKKEAGILIILVLLAFLVRLYERRFHPLIAADGITFIGLAQNLFTGQYQDTFRSLHHHLLYPLLIKVFSFFRGYEMAGVIVSLIMGSLLVVPVFLLGREFYGRHAAYIGSFLIIFDRILVNFSAEVLSESTYLFLLFLGIYLGWMALERKRLTIYSWATLVFTLSYLTKPEGVAGLLILFVWALVSIRYLPRLERRKMALTFLVMATIFITVSSPYLFFLRSKLGYWTLSGKLYRLQAYGLRDNNRDWLTLTDEGKQIFAVSVYDSHSEAARETRDKGESSLLTNLKCNRVGRSLKEAAKLVVSMPFPWIFALAIMGFTRKRREGICLRKEAYLLSFFAFTPLLYSLLFLPKARYLIPILPIIAIWAGRGMEGLISWFSEEREKKLRIVMVFIILFPSFFLIFNPGREMPRAAAREAGLWMKENLPDNPVIMATNSQISYYAGGGVPVVSPYAENLSKILDYARYHKVQYIVVDEESTPRLTPQLQFLLDEGKTPPGELRLIYKYTNQSGDKFLIYELLK